MRTRRLALIIALTWVLGALTLPASADTAPPPAPDSTPPVVDPLWQWPVAGGRSVVQAFIAPAHAYAAGHRGIDVAAAADAVVRAPADGVVAFRGVVVDRPLITVDHGGGIVSTWEPVSSTLAPGTAVSAGDVIGTVSVGGHTAPGALHIGVRWNGAYVNPLPLFGAVQRAVLLPCCEPP